MAMDKRLLGQKTEWHFMDLANERPAAGALWGPHPNLVVGPGKFLPQLYGLFTTLG